MQRAFTPLRHLRQTRHQRPFHAIHIFDIHSLLPRQPSRLPETALPGFKAAIRFNYFVILHFCMRRITENPCVHEREVRHIEEIFDHARRR